MLKLKRAAVAALALTVAFALAFVPAQADQRLLSKLLAPGAAAANLGFTPLNPASNLSDIASASAARSNLGLGALAILSTLDVGTYATGTLPAANGGTGLTAFSRLGNTTKFATASGTFVSGHCVNVDSNNNLTDAGAGCGGGGGGSGTVNSGASNTLAYYASAGTAVSAYTLGTNVLIGLGNAANGATGFALLDGSGHLPSTDFPALSGDVTTSAGSLATVVSSIGGKSVSLAGSLTLSGAYALGLTLTGATTVTMPTSGTLATVNGALGTPSSVTLTNATGLPATSLTGTLQAAQFPAMTGDCTTTAGSLAINCTKTGGTLFGSLATLSSINLATQVTGTLGSGNMLGGSGYFNATFCATVGQEIARMTGGWGCRRPAKLNMLDYGAVGDNYTSNDTPITNAIAALKSLGAGLLYFPAVESGGGQAVYRTSGSITLNADGIGVECENPKAVVLRGTATSNHMFYMTAQHNTVQHCSVDYTTTQVCCGAGVYVNNAPFARIDDMHFVGVFHGLEVDNTGLQTDTVMTDVVMENCVYSAFDLGPSSTQNVNEVFIRHLSTNNCANGGVFGYTNGIYITDYSPHQGAHSMIFAPPSGQYAAGIFCTDCIPDSTTAEAIGIYGPSQGVAGMTGDLHFVGGQCDSNYQCLKVYDGANFRGLFIDGLASDLNLYQSIQIGLVAGSPASSPYYADISIKNSHFCLNNTTGGTGIPAVYVNSQGLTFESNTAGLCGFQAFYHQTASGNLALTSYGLQLGTNVDKAIVTGNRFPLNQNSAGYLNGSGNPNIIISNNITW